jgi:glutaconate CoA-transferase subunit A
MANAYEAGAANLPFAMLRGYIGADLPKVNPNIKRVTCPFTCEVLAAVPAIRPDVTIIHALRADRKGNVLLEGIVGVQKEAVLGAKRSIVTVEEIVDELNPPSRNSVVLPTWAVTNVVEVPAAPFRPMLRGYYPRSNAFYIAWDEIARDRHSFQKWIEENVMTAGPEDFATHAKKAG